MRYGFIGTGNMAQAILEGLSRSNKLSEDQFFAYDIDVNKCKDVAEKYGVHICSSAIETVSSSDVLILAVKPNQLDGLLYDLKFEIKKHLPVLVSLPVGIEIKGIEEKLGFEAPIIRIVANVNAEVFLSVTALCGNDMVNETKKDALDAVIKLLESIGSVVELEENYFDIFTVIASSAPAFVIKFSESLAEAALKEGLPKNTARKIIADMIYGTGKMLSSSNPTEVTDKICSPGGTTIAGLVGLTAGGFEASIHSAAAECMNKLRSNR